MEESSRTIDAPQSELMRLIVDEYMIDPEEMEHDYFRWLMERNEPVRGLGGKEPLVQ